MHTKVEVLDESLRRKAATLCIAGSAHRAVSASATPAGVSEMGGIKLIRAQRENVHLVMGCSTGFSRRSVGYVGFSDGWQDLTDNFKMDWEFESAENGNIALTGEINLPHTGEFTMAVAFGRSYQSTTAKLLQSLAEPFESHRRGICPPVAAHSRESQIRLQRRHIRRRRYVSTKPLCADCA